VRHASGRRPPEDSPERVDLVPGERVQHRLGQRLRKALLRQLRLRVGAASVVPGDHTTVVVGLRVGAHPERLRQRARQPHQEPARLAARRSRLRERAVGTRVAVVPALGRLVAPLEREHAGASETELVDHLAQLVLVDDVVGRVAAEVAGHQPRVVLLGGQDVSGAEVTGLETVAVGHPGGRRDGVRAGDEHHLVDRHGLLARRPRHRHRPAPAAVAGPAALVEVGHHPLVLGVLAEVVAHIGGLHERQQRLAGLVDGTGADRVGLRGPRCGDHNW
jgi:hypothetical protein